MSMPSVSQDILAATTDPELVNADLNLNNCDREPIHIPNLIQPHGVLLAVSAEEYTILQVSLNTSQRLGKDPEQLLKRPLSELLGAEQVQKIQRCLSGKFEEINPLSISLQREGKDFSFDAIVHRTKDIIIVELEPSKPTSEVDFFNFYKQVKSPITKIQKSPTFDELCSTVVKEIRQITGFERVMVYRFDDEGAGQVIAEAAEEKLTPFLGLRYPDTDIPK